MVGIMFACTFYFVSKILQYRMVEDIFEDILFYSKLGNCNVFQKKFILERNVGWHAKRQALD